MGGIFGKPNVMKVEAVNSVINESILKLASSTTSTNNVAQYMEASGAGSVISGNTQYIDVKTNVGSILTATQDSDFDTNLQNDIAQEMKKQSVALLGAFDSLLQNNNVDMETKIKSEVKNLNLLELAPVCAINDNITQSLIATGGATITGNSQTVKADFVQQCISTVSSSMRAISDITNAVNQRSITIVDNPLDVFADMFKGGTTMIIIIIIAIVAGFVILIGPGKLDANAIIMKAMDKGEQAAAFTPPGRAAMLASVAASAATPVAAPAATPRKV